MTRQAVTQHLAVLEAADLVVTMWRGREKLLVVISYQFWQRRFAKDPNAVGTTIRLNGVPHTIIGVAPEGFFGTFVGYQFQFWVPASMQAVFDPSGYKLEDRGARWIEGFVRLKPGVNARAGAD